MKLKKIASVLIGLGLAVSGGLLARSMDFVLTDEPATAGNPGGRDVSAGSWSDKEIADMLRAGLRPNGRETPKPKAARPDAPPLVQDAGALTRYLETLTPAADRLPPAPAANQGATASYLTVVIPR